MNKAIVGILLILLVVGGVYWYLRMKPTVPQVQQQATSTSATSSQEVTPAPSTSTMSIGKSVEGRDILAYSYGTGPKKLLFVGGIHGGYEWNTVLVANQLIDYLSAHSEAVPAGLTVTVIPVLNPDGLSKVVASSTDFSVADVASSETLQISGRYNANGVDLNRNFDCEWSAKGTWQNTTVSGGSAAFSEPESAAFKHYIETTTPDAVVAWYSSAGGVYSSNCHSGVLPATAALTALYAQASGYPPHEVFDYYEITGDMVNWLAEQKIPAISVLLSNHTDTEWDKNLAGIKALLQSYAQ